MNPMARFVTVTALGSLVSGVTVLLFWPMLRGSGVAVGLAFAATLTTLVDDRLARRPRSVWTAIAMGVVSGAAAWATLALLHHW
jgi:hypothetical protein